MVLIKNGLIVDGSGKPPFPGNVLLKGSTISGVGNLGFSSGADVLDARGGYVVPGFIDVNTDSDHYLTLLTHPLQENFLEQGVTTIIGGHCGASLAPLLYGSLESIRKWGDINAVNVDWHSVDEFLNLLERRGIGINFGTLVGHATVRRALTGNVPRDLTEQELTVFSRILKDAMKEGAFGLSTGLGYSSSRGVPYAEIERLAKIVAKSGGVYTTHLRDEEAGQIGAVNEAILIAKNAKVKTIINHYRPLVGFEKEFAAALSHIEAAHRTDSIWFNGYPSDASLVPIYTLLPQWVKKGRLEDMLRVITDQSMRDRLRSDLSGLEAEAIRVVHAPYSPYVIGKTLEDFSINQEISPAEGLLRLMELTKLRAVLLYRNINLDLAIQSLRSDAALVASNSPAFSEMPHLKHERTENMFPKYLNLMGYLRAMPIEHAIRKITALPAEIFKITDRGLLKEGMRADVTVLQNGIPTDVFVNGERAVENARSLHVNAGKVLRKK